jgi:hypothetical protein
MANITKIVPTMITSNLTVSEVNGISLTKAKKSDESSLPTTSFAQILEAQLSQDNTPVEELQTETKQILPGQNVDTSLFGSLIVVVRDVEVPLTEENDSQQSVENNRLFVPTIFTASTASSVSVPSAKKSTFADNPRVTEIENTKPNVLNNEVSTETAKTTISPKATASEVTENSSSFVPKATTSSSLSTNEIEQSESNVSVNNEVEKPVTPVTSVFDANTIVATPTAPTAVNIASNNIKSDTTVAEVSTSAAPTPNTSPTRSLSSMLQSVQGLKMGFERSANQQTFITVALPISEVERLVVANPEVFATSPFTSTSNSDRSTDVITNSNLSSTKETNSNLSSKNVETNSNLSSKNVETNSNLSSTKVITNEFAKDKTVSTTVNSVPTNLQVDNEFIPTSFETIANSNTQAAKISSQSTNSFTPVEQAKATSNSIQTVVENAKPKTAQRTKTTENTTVPATMATLASKIETFATNLQSISSPTSKVTVSTNESETKTTSTSGKEFTYKATVETVSEKRTIVIEPIEKENPIVPTIASKKNITEPTRTITELLQNADSEGSAIESLVVKIPVQATKKPLTTESTFAKDSHLSQTEVTVPTTELATKPESKEVITKLSEPRIQISNKDSELPLQPTVVSPKRDTTQAKDFSTVLQRIENIKQKNTSAPELHSKPVPTSNVETTITETSKRAENTVSKDNTVEKVAVSKTEIKAVSNNGNPIIQNTVEKTTEITKVDSKVTSSNTKSTSIVEPTTFNVENNIVNNSDTEKSTVTILKINKDLPESNRTEQSNIVDESKEQIISIANTVTVPIKSVEQNIKTTVNTEIPNRVTVEELPQAIVKEFVSEKTATGSKATFSLNPEQLGTVNVKIDLQGNNASITLESSQKETIPMLEKQLDQLKDQLKSSNIIVEKLDILFKPTDVVPTSPTMGDTFTNSQQMEQQNLQQEIDRRQQNKQQHSQTNDNDIVDEVQPKRFGDGSSIFEEYI